MSTSAIKSSDYFVFLLGAGFSTVYGPPVMANFMNRARRNYFKRRSEKGTDETIVKCYDEMLQFQYECTRTGGTFERDWENIEEVYTQADLRRLAGMPGAEELCKNIAVAIWDVYRTCNANDLQLLESYLSLILDKIEKDKLSPVVITTNYDLVIERSLSIKQYGSAAAGMAFPWEPYYPGFDRSGNSAVDTFNEDSVTSPTTRQVPIIKLHGSANWFATDLTKANWLSLPCNERLVEVLGAGVADDKFTIEAFEKRLKPNPVRAEEHLTPAIIPPMLGKAAVSPVISRQWRDAIKFIGGAREIWVIGYSFPTTDAFMKRLLSEGLVENQAPPTVVIIDYGSAADWKGKLDDLFTPVMRRRSVRLNTNTMAHEAIEQMANNAKNNWRFYRPAN